MQVQDKESAADILTALFFDIGGQMQLSCQ
jgi:hypothetical protein